MGYRQDRLGILPNSKDTLTFFRVKLANDSDSYEHRPNINNRHCDNHLLGGLHSDSNEENRSHGIPVANTDTNLYREKMAQTGWRTTEIPQRRHQSSCDS
jgi:hypothetical protein